MSLIKSISGIRGTIGGKVQQNLTPIDIVIFASAYAMWLKETSQKQKLKVVIGRDARISGQMVQQLVQQTLIAMGVDIVDLGLSTTPTVEVAVVHQKADGGIILTASHNPKQWNALKLLNSKGEFISAKDGEKLLEFAQNKDFIFSEINSLGKISCQDTYMDWHIEKVLNLPVMNISSIKNKRFKVVVDAVNSTGGIIVPKMLRALGCDVVELYCTANGDFPHNPEPLKEHLSDICQKVVEEKADFGIVIDPDVDRLAFITEKGEMFGEEYTLVACADYVLSKQKGNVVSNLSSSRALKDLAKKYNVEYFASAVGEVNVVEKMKEVDAIIGGEGNGGVIYPALHYGRDAIVGIGLFLSLLSEKNITLSQLKNSYSQYYMSKNKIELTEGIDVDGILVKMAKKYAKEQVTTIDGVKIDFENSWVHLRKSNTEPIIRIYTEAQTLNQADELAKRFVLELKEI